MSTFKPVTFDYQGDSITVPANQVLRLISVVESHYNPLVLMDCKFQSAATIALFYAPILRYVGFKNVDDEVLARHFAKNPEAAAKVAVECIELLNALNPPEALRSEITTALPSEEAADTPNDPAKKRKNRS